MIDGIDQIYTKEGIQIASTLIHALGFDKETTPWHLIITCQTQEWPRIREMLFQYGMTAMSLKIVNCTPLTIKDLDPIWEKIPIIEPLRKQKILFPLLTNLKILDLIVTRLIAGDDLPSSEWVGESSIANWFWMKQIESGSDPNVRARFLTLLAERQADELRSSISIHEFEISEITSLSGLVRDGICYKTKNDHIIFNHELFGDWARFRLLSSHSTDLVEYLKKRLDSPLWHRAIRLYGTYLLEHVGDLNNWREVHSSISSNCGKNAGDLLLDSMIFSANPTILLDLAKSDLMKDHGRLLKRLFKRFLSFATYPDPNIKKLAEEKGYNIVDISTKYRYPNWQYWPSFLRFLDNNRSEMLSLVPAEVGRMIELWLSHTPPGFILRKEVAEMGLMLGEEALISKHRFRVKDKENRKSFFRIALLGASEIPDDVSAFALKASKRSSEIMEIVSDLENGKPETNGVKFSKVFEPSGPIPEPWEDGPKSRIDDEFRDEVLDNYCLIPLTQINPSVAREVILATLINPPSRSLSHHFQFDRFDSNINDGLNWLPPLYSRGFFLQFLKINFEEGLEVILRLVDFCTERWQNFTEKEAKEYKAQEQKTGGRDDPLQKLMKESYRLPETVILPLENGDRELIGDERVYGWSQGLDNPPNAIIVALMALEKYLYTELDEGRPIEDKIKTILSRIRSTAFLRVLCDIGKREPPLFLDSLRPLLAIPEMYSWEIYAFTKGHTHLMLFSPYTDEEFIKTAKEFNEMGHRSINLRQMALSLFLNSSDIQEYLTKARRRWEEEFTKYNNEQLQNFIKQLIVEFNIDNYQIEKDPDLGEVYVNVRSRELEMERSEENQEFQESSLINFFPFHCRKQLDEKIVMSDDELKGFWNTIQLLDRKFQDIEGSDFSSIDMIGENIVNGLVGGIAVLICNNRKWLYDRPEYFDFCVEYLQYFIENPPQKGKYDVPENVSKWTWDCFASEAIPNLWKEDPKNIEIRYLISRLVFSYHYQAINILFQRCSENRIVLKDDFKRLQNLLLNWAHVRNIIISYNSQYGITSKYSQEQFDERMKKWISKQISDFSERRYATEIEKWEQRNEFDYFGIEDTSRLPHHGTHYLDLSLIIHAYSWMPQLDASLDNIERSEWIIHWKEALQFIIMRGMKSFEIRDGHYYPNEDERLILRGVAGCVQGMKSEEEPEYLWKQILNLPSELHNWSKNFFMDYHIIGLSKDSVSPNFINFRNEMIEYTFENDSSESGDLKWPFFDEVWQALIGIDSITRDCWKVHHKVYVQNNLDIYKKWFDKCSKYGRHQMAFLNWLRLDVGQSIRIKVIIWFDELLTGKTINKISDIDSVYNPLAFLIQLIWKIDEQQLRKDEKSFGAFKRLLRWLANEQNPVALELLGRIGRLIS